MGTYTGTDEPDTIEPGFVSDGVVAAPAGSTPGNGNDSLFGQGGGDWLAGGGGADDVHGGNGNDQAFGGLGDDLLYGDEGDDGLYGDEGGDSLFGGPGSDALEGRSDNDELHGDDGDDVLDGGYGDDLLYGGAGDDRLGGAEDNDMLYGEDGADWLEGGTGADWLEGGDGDDILFGDQNGGMYGDPGNDVLIGGNGSDALHGDFGADIMRGGAGDDEYFVDNGSDAVMEDTADANGGRDTVHASLSFTLGFGLENLVLEGYDHVDGTGNDLDNALTGNSSDNVLNGGGGADRMSGGAGDDDYHVDNAGDVVIDDYPYDGLDEVFARVSFTLGPNIENLFLEGTAEINGTGNDRNNILVGNDARNRLGGLGGNDILDGGRGPDVMTGGGGHDDYYVDSKGDLVVEAAGRRGGVDEVGASVSHTLGANVENLFLLGRTSIRGTGNVLDNELWGNTGVNVLDGKAGNDYLFGNLQGDVLRGQAGNDYLAGGIGRDDLQGGDGNDLLFGSLGKDRLDGGRGHDWFVFDTPKDGVDSIVDFQHQGPSEDGIGIWAKGFGAGLRKGDWLSEAQFESSSTNEAQDRSTRFVFRTTDETLWFDQNGSGTGGLRLVADLQDGAQVTADDIWLA